MAFAQTNDADQKGSPSDGIFHKGDVDNVNIQNGNLHIDIPLVSLKQRGGGTISWDLVYDTQAWQKLWVASSCGGSRSCFQAGAYVFQQNPNVVSGWRVVPSQGWTTDFVSATLTCATSNQQYTANTNWVVIDPQGSTHATALRQEVGGSCLGQTLSGPTTDGSGYTFDINTGVVRGKNGAILASGVTPEDSNGNLLSASTDTLGRTPISVSTGPTINYITPLGMTVSGPQYTRYTVTDSNGGSEIYEIDYQAVDELSDICANSGLETGVNCTDGSAPELVNQKLILPNGKSYTFTYANETPGDLSQLTLPTGATINYSYADFYQAQWGSHGTNPSYSGSRAVTKRAVTVGSVTNTWTYNYAAGGGMVTVLDPLGNTQIHYLANVSLPGESFLSANRYEYEVDYQNSSGNALRKVNTSYTANIDYVNKTLINVRPTSQTVTLESGQQSQTQTDYETFTYTCTVCNTDAGEGVGIATRMNPTEIRTYDYGSGAPGALIKRVDYTYLHNANTNYVPLNIVNRVASVSVYDGGGNLVSQTLNEYDNYNHPNQPLISSGAIQHDPAFGTGYTMRGNKTAVSRWRNTDGAYLTSTTQYDDAGNVISVIDPLGHQSYIDYTDSWANTQCAAAGQTKAFPTKVTNSKGQFSTSTYNSCTGTVATSTDANLQTTSTTYGLLDRTYAVVYPSGGGSKTYCYSDDPTGGCYSASALYENETETLSSSISKTMTTAFDSIGRPVELQLTSDPDGTVLEDTQYDGLSRAYKTSNPYRSGDTVYWTTKLFDAIGRSAGVADQDGSSTSITYSGNTTLSADEAGHQRKIFTDALGRITEVQEDPSGLNYETDYSYDLLGDVLTITQKGGDPNSSDWRIRTFTYNSLGQLLCSANPEIGSPLATVATCPTADSGTYIAGTVRYSYDNDGNVVSKTSPLPNQQGPSTVIANYSYERLNRLAGASYSDGTPSETYTYDNDTSPCAVPPLTATNLIGHMKSMCDGSGSTSWSYDNLGRTTVEERTIGGVTDQILYSYYNDGSVNTVTYPLAGATSAFSLIYSMNGAGRIYSVTDGTGYTYAHVFDTWATGVSKDWQLGANIALSNSYNSRLQPLQSSAVQIGTNNALFNRTYNFNLGNGDNGNLAGVVDALDQLDLPRPNGSVNYSYDNLNRIASASTLGTDCTGEPGGTKDWGSTYSVDAWGNLTAKTSTLCVGESMPSSNVNTRNRLPVATYDSAGNMTQDPSGLGYTFDGENRLTGGSGSVYVYDGSGERVAKSGSKLYWKGVGSTALMETDTADQHPTTYIFFNGSRIARIDPGSGSPRFYIADNIGSTAAETDAVGNLLNESLFFPYGVERQIAVGDPANNYKFSGKERDPETGLDNFGARLYDSALGRFTSPDWAAKPSAVPYSSFGDPQTLNLYSYVQNGPLNRVDADGHAAMSSAMGKWAQPALGIDLDPFQGCYDADPVHCGHTADGSTYDPNPQYMDEREYENYVAIANASFEAQQQPLRTSGIPRDASQIAPPPAVAGTLTISTDVGGGIGSALGSHAWLTFTTDDGITYTYATYGNDAGQQGVHGVNQDSELDEHASATRSMHISGEQTGKLDVYISDMIKQGPGAWSADWPCSGFAAVGWNLTTGENLDPTRHGILNSPANLEGAINAANAAQ